MCVEDSSYQEEKDEWKKIKTCLIRHYWYYCLCMCIPATCTSLLVGWGLIVTWVFGAIMQVKNKIINELCRF